MLFSVFQELSRPRPEIQASEIKAEVKAEVKAEIRAEIRAEIKAEIKAEIPVEQSSEQFCRWFFQLLNSQNPSSGQDPTPGAWGPENFCIDAKLNIISRYNY